MDALLLCSRLACAILLLSIGPVAAAQTPAAQQPPVAPQGPRPPAPRVFGAVPPPTAPASVEKLDANRLRVGNVYVDLKKREVSVAGVINDVPVLEFVANTKGGYKAYESAIEADTNAINFNLGLILIGLDRAKAVRPRFHFDPVTPAGDAVEVWVAWTAEGKERRVRAEELIFDDGRKSTLPISQWVYTGSSFMPNSTAFLADLDGVLIGFVHTPAPLIENAGRVPGPYGTTKVNPTLGLKPGSPVTLIVRALPPPGPRK